MNLLQNCEAVLVYYRPERDNDDCTQHCSMAAESGGEGGGGMADL